MKSTSEAAIYTDATHSLEERVADLVSRMTLAEKVSQMMHPAAAIPRLGVSAYDWWNECLHGVARAGIATVFPQAIGLAATWDRDLVYRAAVAISDEARAKHHAALTEDGSSQQYFGLTFWTPNINIFRDPRWGRGQETYGEDPYLTGRMGVAFVKGLQGDDPKYLKLVATPKHYAVHSGPEADRHTFDAQVSARDLRETYLPAFEACVREAGAVSIMGAYNRTNGEPCCASPTLLQQILRDEWGFEGYVVSDCGAIHDIFAHHKVVSTMPEAAALAVKNGCDLNCGETYAALQIAVGQGLIDEAALDKAVSRLFMARFRLGMFDPPEQVPYTRIPIEVNDCAEHRALALRAAQESIVLLKNAADLLPLRRDGLQTVAVIGPNADDPVVLLSNYNGTPSSSVTPLQGIRDKVGTGVSVVYARGCGIRGKDSSGFAEAVAAAQQADVVVAVMGLAQIEEGEEGQEEGVAGGLRSSGDRVALNLPGVQEQLLEAVYATGKPLIVILLNGSAVAVNWAQAHAAAIVEAWYPGEEGGTAIADVLFGDYNPAGRLPVTFYKSVEDLPPFTDYAMEGKTYRYFRKEPLYPFGFGLSFTTFAYADLRISQRQIAPGQSIEIEVKVCNSGARDGDEVVQLYVTGLEARGPICQLQGFARIHLAAGETQTVRFTLTPQQMSVITESGARQIEPGPVGIWVGAGQPNSGAAGLQGAFEIRGAMTRL